MRLIRYSRPAEVFNLTFVNQLFHRFRHLFDRHVRVNTVLIEQIDGIYLKSLEPASLVDKLAPPTIVAWAKTGWPTEELRKMIRIRVAQLKSSPTTIIFFPRSSLRANSSFSRRL